MTLITDSYVPSLAYDPSLLAAQQATKKADPSEAWRAAEQAAAKHTDASSESAATGTTASRLSPETEKLVIEAAQQTDDTTKPENAHLWEIANNPDYADEQAPLIGNSYDLQFFPSWEDVETYMQNGGSTVFNVDTDNASHPIAKTQRARSALYDKLVSEGRSPTDIILEIYRFNARQPDSYSDLLDPSGHFPQGNYQAEQQKNISLLEQYLADARPNVTA